MSAVLASAEAVGDGVVVFRHDEGELVFEDPQRAMDAARQLMDAAQLGLNLRAGAIAESRALVGSASHHMDRGATSAFHYDRRAAALEGPPITDLDEIRDNVGGASKGGFAPGDSPVTGTGQASIDALEGMTAVGVGASASPPVDSTEGLQGGPAGTVSPEPPGEAMASQGEGGTPVPLEEAVPQADGADANANASGNEEPTVKELQAQAKAKGVKGASKMKKAELQKALKE
jgi:hypothetical protein